MPKLFLVDPLCALVNCYHEVTDTLRRLFAAEGRTIKHYFKRDENQLPPELIQSLCQQAGEQVLSNSFGVVVREFTSTDFVARCQPAHAEYIVE